MDEFEELEGVVEELKDLETLPPEVVKDLKNEGEWVVVRIRKPVHEKLVELKHYWGARSISHVIAKLMLLAAARKSEIRAVCRNEDYELLNKGINFLLEHGDEILAFLKNISKGGAKA